MRGSITPTIVTHTHISHTHGQRTPAQTRGASRQAQRNGGAATAACTRTYTRTPPGTPAPRENRGAEQPQAHSTHTRLQRRPPEHRHTRETLGGYGGAPALHHSARGNEGTHPHTTARRGHARVCWAPYSAPYSVLCCGLFCGFPPPARDEARCHFAAARRAVLRASLCFGGASGVLRPCPALRPWPAAIQFASRCGHAGHAGHWRPSPPCVYVRVRVRLGGKFCPSTYIYIYRRQLIEGFCCPYAFQYFSCSFPYPHC